MAIIDTTPEGVAKIILGGIKETLKMHLRAKIQTFIKEEVDNIVEEVCKSAVFHVQGYKDNMDNTTNIIFQIDGLKREINGSR